MEAEIPYQPGRLAMFLPETPHAVTPLTGPGSRAVLFMWFHCRQFTQPPGRYYLRLPAGACMAISLGLYLYYPFLIYAISLKTRGTQEFE